MLIMYIFDIDELVSDKAMLSKGATFSSFMASS